MVAHLPVMARETAVSAVPFFGPVSPEQPHGRLRAYGKKSSDLGLRQAQLPRPEWWQLPPQLRRQRQA
jgi:hypothetical protein